MIADMCEQLVTNRTWCEGDMKYIMLYTGCVFGFEFTARVGEYTKAEQKATDHCLWTDDFSFAVEAPTGHFSIVGSALAELPRIKLGRASRTFQSAVSEE
jgi:hypothetical protein